MAHSSSSSPTKSPRRAEDIVPDFDLKSGVFVYKPGLTWAQAKDKIAMVGLSVLLHQLLHEFDPERIGPSPGPYSHSVIAESFSNYIVTNRQILTDPALRGYLIARRIPELRLIVGQDQFKFNELAPLLRKHLMLLDIVDVVLPN